MHTLVRSRVPIGLAVFILMILPAVAAAGSAKLTGRITDARTGEALAGANVVVTHTFTDDGKQVPLERPIGAAADAEGYYIIINMQPGYYIAKASMIGYTAMIQTRIRIESDRTITVNFPLAPTGVEVQAVVVTAERPTIKADVSATREVVNSARLEQMPVLRVDEFVTKLKGVELVSGAGGNGISVRGGGIRETDVRLDGISLQDPRSENSYLALNTTTIQEIQVLTGGFEAKYGGIRSGLLNIITKEGYRDRYTVSMRVDAAPANQKHFFGQDPYSPDSWIYRVYAGEWAMRGVDTAKYAKDKLVPAEFQKFGGWNNPSLIKRAGNIYLDSLQNLDLWKRQHPVYKYGNKVDLFVEGSITGPVPGADLPIWGDYAKNTTFLLGFKYEDSQLAFPIGPRQDYIDWNAQLKLTTTLSDNLKLALNGLYSTVSTVNAGQTSSYGGALVDQSSSFNFLNSTRSSVSQQARLIAGTDGLWQLFNKSRLQFYDQRYFVGGARITHTISNTAYQTFDLQFGYTDQQLSPFSLDTSRADAWVVYKGRNGKYYRYQNGPQLGTPNGSTNWQTDILNQFWVYGGLQRIDSSKSWVAQFKWDLTTQIGRHHQVEAGFSARLTHLFVYAGSWYQAQISYTPDLWQYYTATPLDMGAYIQDKLEFDGMVLNAGVRFDFLNPMKEGYQVGMPLDDGYKKLYDYYMALGGSGGGYERWLQFRDQLENPNGWPRTSNRTQFYVSPRLGVSFPITESSKLYFNYGHFYQRPPTSFMYNQTVTLGSVSVPTPDLDMTRTISYEFGYEQMLFDEVLLNTTAYYKDIRNDPLARTFYNYYHDNIVTKYFPDSYGDIRGIEFRVERPVGKYWTLSAMADYLISSSGQSGLANVYENRLEATNEQRSAALYTTDPKLRVNASLNLMTPAQFGPDLFGIYLLDRWQATFLFEWRQGVRMLWNPEESDIKKQIWVDAVDWWNIDFRLAKAFDLNYGTVEFVLTVKNLTNNRFLSPENMTLAQYNAYKASLRFPFNSEHGTDKWGQYESSDGHIKTGWYTAPIFLNPRQIVLGMRLNF